MNGSSPGMKAEDRQGWKFGGQERHVHSDGAVGTPSARQNVGCPHPASLSCFIMRLPRIAYARCAHEPIRFMGRGWERAGKPGLELQLSEYMLWTHEFAASHRRPGYRPGQSS